MKMKTLKSLLSIHFLTALLSVFSCKGPSTIDKGVYEEKLNSVSSIQLDPSATVIYHDKKDNLWLASNEKGIYRYDGGSLDLYTQIDGLPSYRVLSVQEDTAGNLYFDTPDGVCRYDGVSFTTLKAIEDNATSNEWKSQPDDLWFRSGWSHNGPYRYDGKNLYQLTFPPCELHDAFYEQYPNASFTPYGIYSLFKDSKGNVWFGTAGMGVYMYDGETIHWMYEEQLTKTPSGGDFGIRSIAEDKDGNYWICNPYHKYTLSPSLAKIDGLNPLAYKRTDGIVDTDHDDLYFFSMETDRNGNILMYANSDGMWLNDGKTLSLFYITDGQDEITPNSVHRDRHGILWLGTDGHGIYTYDGESFVKVDL